MHKALDKLPGVASVNPNINTRVATLKVDPVKFVLKDAIAALKKAGYTKCSLVKEKKKG